MNPVRLFKIFAAALLACSALRAAEPDIVIADFEGKNYGLWKVEGTAFGNGPAPGTLPGQMPVEGFIGKGLANSFVGGDDARGKLTSPEFTITRQFVAFRIGGGGWQGKTSLNLLVDGKIVRTATGPNVKPGGSEALVPQGWEASELIGKTAHIEIVDNATGGWGHINVDQIVLTDTKPPVAPKLFANVSREIIVTNRWLNFPIKNGAKPRVLTVNLNGKIERRLEAELADAEPDWWAPLDVSVWRGKTFVLTANELLEGSRALEQIKQSDDFPEAPLLYHERLRPQFHFSARRGWLNDPNGLVFFNGEYHMFFQHSPFSWNGTLKHWGHAVSRDLVHWEEIGEALDPDELGSMWSGSGVVDWKNASGFGKEGKPPLVLFYTAAGPTFTQCTAHSTDGRVFTKDEKNPVLKQVTDGNRDPKVIWHEPSHHWIMVLYVGHEIPASPGGKARRRDTVQFFVSSNLQQWTYASENEGYYECPDLFELPLDDDRAQRKWVLTAANTNYQIGAFDGKTFVPETPILPGQRGNGMYAPQTFSDMPDGRRIQIGWGTTPAPGMPFNQMMTCPCELTLRTTAEGPRIFWQPVKELDLLRAKTHSLKSQPLTPGDDNPLAQVSGQFFDIRVELEPGDAAQIVFNIRGTAIIYDAKKRELVCREKTAPLAAKNGRVRLEILVDRLSLEIFGNDGLVYMPMSMLPKDEDQSLALGAKDGTATIHSLVVHELHSIWPEIRPH
jgi:sucrose-6-phosphate hydrolase SacC (GH32 family)